MSETPSPSQRTRFLLTNLVILIIFILTLVFLVVAYPTLLAPAPTATPTLTLTPTSSATVTPTAPTSTTTLTPSPSFTPRPTHTPTQTASPTQTLTPTLTLTPTGPPTLTPARPVLGNESYRLRIWTPELASQMVALLDYYPNTLSVKARGEDDAAYYAAFHPAIVAQREALLRFPDAPQSDEWRWGLAYNLARTGDAQAAAAYSDLIVQALNRDETPVNELFRWFPTKEPRLQLDLVNLTPPSGYQSSYLVQIRGNGAAFIRLLQTTSGFQAEVLTSDFDFVHHPQANALLSDLNADGIEDVAIFFTTPPSEFTLQPPKVFNLAVSPASPMEFLPSQVNFDLGMQYENHWTIQQNSTGPADLVFAGQVFPACPLTMRRAYRWNGAYFELVQQSYAVKLPSPDNLSSCQDLVDHAAKFWGPQAALYLVETTLNVWPPNQDSQGKPYPLDAPDEWRFREGVYQALSGDFQGAQATFNQIVAHPSIPLSRWIEPARAFLAAYENPGDLYRACVQAQFCDPATAIRQLVGDMPAEQYAQAIQNLWQAGVTLRASGYFDFDGDGTSERWFTVRHHPGEKLEFWILASSRSRMQALLIGTVDENLPTITILDPEQIPPIIWLGTDLALIMSRDPVSLQPYIQIVPRQFNWPNRYQEGLAAAEQALFNGTNPATVRSQLLELQTNPGLLCRPYWTCDPYYYLLGLASELSGNPEQARDAYLRVWWDYSKSPYTSMARMKLIGASVAPSATPPASPASTSTATPQPTTTGTPPTATSTPTATPTLTPGTPYPF